MFEQSKSAKRRFHDGYFHSKYFTGDGIDIGCGEDSIGRYLHVFRLIKSVRPWDVQDGNATYMESVPDNTFDFVNSSHSLEHMDDPYIALTNWIRILKPGGYCVITIPEETMYEKDSWPSKYNPEHTHSFTLKGHSQLPKSVNVLQMCHSLLNICTVEKIQLIEEFYDWAHYQHDQTMSVTTECAIEIILRKK